MNPKLAKADYHLDQNANHYTGSEESEYYKINHYNEAEKLKQGERERSPDQRARRDGGLEDPDLRQQDLQGTTVV